MEKRKPTREELEALEECADWLAKIYESIIGDLNDILAVISHILPEVECNQSSHNSSD